MLHVLKSAFKSVSQQIRLFTGLNEGGITRKHRSSTRLAAILFQYPFQRLRAKVLERIQDRHIKTFPGLSSLGSWSVSKEDGDGGETERGVHFLSASFSPHSIFPFWAHHSGFDILSMCCPSPAHVRAWQIQSLASSTGPQIPFILELSADRSF